VLANQTCELGFYNNRLSAFIKPVTRPTRMPTTSKGNIVGTLVLKKNNWRAIEKVQPTLANEEEYTNSFNKLTLCYVKRIFYLQQNFNFHTI